MLTFKVEYVTGVCMATRHDDPTRRTPEWPPHPDRFFSALVAAAAEAHAADGDENAEFPEPARVALQWLLNQGAPHLAASAARWRTAPEVHVPSNPHADEVWQGRNPNQPQASFDLLTLLPVHRKKAALPIPAIIPDDPVVHFMWPHADSSEVVHRRLTAGQILRGIAKRVTYMGRSRSLVNVSVVTEVGNATHVPDPLGQVQLRVPGSDRLDYLIEKYHRDGGKPEPCPPSRYRTLDGDSRHAKTVKAVFDRMFIFRVTPTKGNPLLPAESTISVTQGFRNALISCIEPLLSG